MAQESLAFEWICQAIEAKTSLSRLQARGIVRWALRRGGLSAHTVTPAQVHRLLADILRQQLRRCGVGEADQICEKLMAELIAADLQQPSAERHAADDAFERMFGMPSGGVD